MQYMQWMSAVSDRASRYKQVRMQLPTFRTQCFTMKIVQRIPILLIIVYVCIGTGYTQTTCRPDQFRCNNGECIASELLCDGKANCTDSSDETENECKKPEISCPNYAFRCGYGACINKSYICNGIQDCIDNSDETQALCNSNTRSNNQTGNLTGKCKQDQYKCDNGQCIHITDQCDGTRNCEDGSDETFTLCGWLPCLPIAFHCKYGACINSDLQCDGINNCADGSDEDPKLCGGAWPTSQPTTIRSPSTRPPPPSSTNTCIAPPQPENGQWKLHPSQCANKQECNVAEGTEMGLGSYLLYSCNRGYKITDTTNVICSFQGKWQPAIPTCTEIRCKALDTVSIRAECNLDSKWISCKSPVPPDTQAELSCENSYQSATNLNVLNSQRNNVICNSNGQWEPEPLRCIPVCGTLRFKVNPTVWGSYRANITEFPWHANMYLDEQGEKKFICGASIIQATFLITAAHCVFNQNNRQLYKPNTIHILTGNIFRDYNDSNHNPNFVQANQVKHIYVDRHYLGNEGNFLKDIAILELVTPFVFSATLVPVCIDTLNDKSILDPNAFGKIAGFGRTATGDSSALLQALTVPVIPPSQCWSAGQNPKTQRYFTNDKFCAGYTNGSSVCDSDSGGGLVFETDNLWYLRGIVSVSLGTKEGGGNTYCDNNLYTLYTDISRYISWIETVITHIERNQTHTLCSEVSPTRCS